MANRSRFDTVMVRLLLFVVLAVPLSPAAHAQPPRPLYALVDAATQRLQTADDVSASKWISGGAITDPVRVAAVLDAVRADATAQSLDPEFVADVFTDQIDATESVEYTLFGRWKIDPRAAPTSAPDLASSRQEIDALNRTMVAELARQRGVLASPQCRVELDAARSEVAFARSLDALYLQALAFATRSYCIGAP